MNIPELFSSLSQLSLFQGIWLGVTMALLLTLTFVIRPWPVSLPLLAISLGVIGVVISGYFAPYYGLLVWFAALFAAGMLAVAHEKNEILPPPPLTPLTLIGLVSAPLLITAVTGLLAFWPAVQIRGSFELTWVVFLLLGLSLWQLLRSRDPLPRTAAFLCALAGLALWQALRLDSPVVVVIWTIFTLLATFIGSLFGRPQPEFNHGSG